MNAAMRPHWAAAAVRLAGDRLSPRLCGRPPIAFREYGGGVYFAGALAANPHQVRDPEDLMATEARINSLHLDDVVNMRRRGWEARCVAQGIRLAEEVLARAAPLTVVPLEIVITVDDGRDFGFPSSTFRFYGCRGTTWVGHDLEGFDQPVAVLRAG